MPEGDKTSLKLKLLDVEAELSCAAAELSFTPPKVAAAVVHLEAARQALLDMAEREELIEKAPLMGNARCHDGGLPVRFLRLGIFLAGACFHGHTKP